MKKASFTGRNVVSVYFGGGTPFLLGPDGVFAILETLIGSSSCVEVTIEANPESIELSVLKTYFAAGINRLSIGVQSFNDEELLLLCRRHTVFDSVEAIDKARTVGFDNISIDLMYDLPQQTSEQWEKSLTRACTLPITHLSLYNLTIEPKTAWFRKKDKLNMPNSEASADMYSLAIQTVESNGFSQYEISAFAKPGFRSVHNSGYWIGREFIGFGPSAFSFFNGVRFSNFSDLTRYQQLLSKGILPIDFHDTVTPLERVREMVAVGLRMNDGITLESIESRFGATDESLRQKLDSFAEEGLLSNSLDHYALTTRGRMVYDTLAVDLI